MHTFKKLFYFPVASYFAFWAKIRLQIWKPTIVVITGSAGKTFLLSLFQNQLGSSAIYSHKANSSFGIPFHILGLKRTSNSLLEWPKLFFLTPFCVFKKIPSQSLYIVEADCDRSFEGRFLSILLTPDICCWLNISLSHSVNFPYDQTLKTIANEFGYFAKNTKKLLLYNADQKEICEVINKINIQKIPISINNLKRFGLETNKTIITTSQYEFEIPAFLPKESYYALSMLVECIKYLDISFKNNFQNFHQEPGRSTVLKAIKNSTIIDSTYNANLSSMESIIHSYSKLNHIKKWLIIGDMIDLGTWEKDQHEKLAQFLLQQNVNKVIFVGKRLIRYIQPVIVQNKPKFSYIFFSNHSEAKEYIVNNVEQDSILLFKGAGFLEEIIKALLLHKEDEMLLCRQEKFWLKRKERFYK